MWSSMKITLFLRIVGWCNKVFFITGESKNFVNLFILSGQETTGKQLTQPKHQQLLSTLTINFF